jgi:hypothetical protein
MASRKYTPEMLAEAAAQARNVTGVLRLLGVKVSGGSHAHISRLLKRFGIETSHFTGHAHNRGVVGLRHAPPEKRFVTLPPGSHRTHGARLRQALLRVGVPEACALCGVGSLWLGRPLTLHVDHINGDFLDNRRHNLRLLCPNCHSQTPTYAGSRRGGSGTVSPYGHARPATPPPTKPEKTAPTSARPRRRLSGTVRAEIVRFALEHPRLSMRSLAALLQSREENAIDVSHQTLRTVLLSAGLNTVEARLSAAARRDRHRLDSEHDD